MATNKRKDAAALFELIDKSSLKVPKNAGALKIPSWWTSKVNPPTTGNAKTAAALSAAKDEAVVEEQAEKVEPEKDVKGQAKLFVPPSAGVENGESPSIRPPGPTRNVAATVPVESNVRPVEAAAVKSAESPRNGYETGRKNFRPQTMDQGAGLTGREYTRKPLFNFSRVPVWALVVAASLVIVVIFLIVFLFTRGGKSAGTASGGGTPVVNSGGQVTGPVIGGGPEVPVKPLLPIGVVNGGNTNTGGGQVVNGGGNGGAVEPSNGGVGQVYEPGQVTRDPNLFYIIVTSSVAESVARGNAKFLAEHGVDVSVETKLVKSTGKMWWVIVSAKGYPTMTATVPERKKIVEIGHLTNDYKLHHKAWDDAFAVKNLGPPVAK